MEGPSPERLLPAIATRNIRVFWLEEGKREESAVDAEDLLPMLSQRVLFMSQMKGVDWIKRQKMKCRIQFVWIKNEKPGAKKSFYSTILGVPCTQGTRNCSKC